MIDTWPANSPDMNTTEHVLDVFGRKVNQRNPQCQTIAELTNTILKERQWKLHWRLRLLAHGMDFGVNVVVIYSLLFSIHSFKSSEDIMTRRFS